MKTKAAVAWQAGKPLTIETVELQGFKIRKDAPVGKVFYMGGGVSTDIGFDLMKSGESIHGAVLF